MNEKLLEEIKQFLDYAERECVIDIEVNEELKDFADYYIERIHKKQFTILQKDAEMYPYFL